MENNEIRLDHHFTKGNAFRALFPPTEPARLAPRQSIAMLLANRERVEAEREKFYERRPDLLAEVTAEANPRPRRRRKRA